MLKTYASKGGIIPTDQMAIDKRAFPFVDDETVIDVTVAKARYENYPSLSALPITGTKGTLGYVEFNIQPTSDGTLYDLHNSYIDITTVFANHAALDYSLSQFGSDLLVQDCQIWLDSTPVNEYHTNLYPNSAFVKDILLRERPTILSNQPDSNTDPSQDSIEEGNYLAYNLEGNFTEHGDAQASGVYTKTIIDNNTVHFKIFLKDSIFMTKKYFPTNVTLRILITTNLYNLLQQEVTAVTDHQITNATFMLKRVWLTEEASQTYQSILRTKDLLYTLPYSRVRAVQIPAGTLMVQVPNVFTDNYRPDLLCVYFVDNTVVGNPSAANKGYPSVACGAGGINAVESAAGCKVTSMYVDVNGVQYPPPESGQNYMATNNLSCYNEYVDNCIQMPENVYLNWIHFQNHYTVYCINLRDDKQKWYNCVPTVENKGFNFYANITAAAHNLTMYLVGFNNVELQITPSGKVYKKGF